VTDGCVEPGLVLCLFLLARLVFPASVDVNSHKVSDWLLIRPSNESAFDRNVTGDEFPNRLRGGFGFAGEKYRRRPELRFDHEF